MVRRRPVVGPLVLMLSVAGCGEAAGTAGQDAEAGATKPAAATTAVAGAVADKSDAAARRTPSESDRLALELAEAACKAVDFGPFFRAFGSSWAVREKYAASSVRVGVEGHSVDVPKRRYLDQNDYPVSPMDNDYVTAESATLFGSKAGTTWRDLRYVSVEFNTANDNRRRVDWLPGIFDKNLDPPPPGLEEGLGALVRQTGAGGYLLFYPTKDCWELVSDIRNAPARR